MDSVPAEFVIDWVRIYQCAADRETRLACMQGGKGDKQNMARRRQAVTIKHIADDAGVSLQAVSRVINGEPQLTAIDQPIAATISKAVELLIATKHSTASEHPVVVKGSLVERGSTTPLATHARG